MSTLLEGLRRCTGCNLAYHSDTSLINPKGQVHVARLPVSCCYCGYTVCYQCVRKQHRKELKERTNSSSVGTISCPRSRCNRENAFRVSDPVINIFGCHLLGQIEDIIMLLKSEEEDNNKKDEALHHATTLQQQVQQLATGPRRTNIKQESGAANAAAGRSESVVPTGVKKNKDVDNGDNNVRTAPAAITGAAKKAASSIPAAAAATTTTADRTTRARSGVIKDNKNDDASDPDRKMPAKASSPNGNRPAADEGSAAVATGAVRTEAVIVVTPPPAIVKTNLRNKLDGVKVVAAVEQRPLADDESEERRRSAVQQANIDAIVLSSDEEDDPNVRRSRRFRCKTKRYINYYSDYQEGRKKCKKQQPSNDALLATSAAAAQKQKQDINDPLPVGNITLPKGAKNSGWEGFHLHITDSKRPNSFQNVCRLMDFLFPVAPGEGSFYVVLWQKAGLSSGERPGDKTRRQLCDMREKEPNGALRWHRNPTGGGKWVPPTKEDLSAFIKILMGLKTAPVLARSPFMA